MSLGSDTAPLRRELEAALPERPFGLRFWDGSELPATGGGDALLTARSPRAVAHALLAPGQLGLSRAYVSGELEVDDLDALLAALRDWQPPPLGAHASAGCCSAPHAPPGSCFRRGRPAWSCARAASATASRATAAPCATTTTSPTTSSRCSSRTR